jgi:hypothetical protein
MSRKLGLAIVVIATMLSVSPVAHAAPRKPHVVLLGAARKVAYSKVGDPAGALASETELSVRPLRVDGVLKEWTTGDAHDVTDRSFVIRRVIRINDALPNEPASAASASGATSAPSGNASSSTKTSDITTAGAKPASARAASTAKPASARAESTWVWQRGPWLLVDRVTGHVIALKLPDYDPGVSQLVWFRDYGAYCGVTATGKSLYAVVAQVEARKPVLAKKLAPFDPENHPEPVCGPAEWQREPLRVTFHPTGREAVSFEVIPGSAVLVEDAGDEPEKTK